jgi:hypothetical protein
MKLLITTLTIICISFGALADKRIEENCKQLHSEIKATLTNYFLVFKFLKSTDTKEYYDSEKRRASDYLDEAHKKSNIYNAVCKD